MVSGIFFFTFSKVNVDFTDKKLTWRIYIAAKALPITKRVQIINQKEFAKTTLDLNDESFVVHVITITLEITIYLTRKAQIDLLKAEEALITVSAEYSDFIDVFSK